MAYRSQTTRQPIHPPRFPSADFGHQVEDDKQFLFTKKLVNGDLRYLKFIGTRSRSWFDGLPQPTVREAVKRGKTVQLHTATPLEVTNVVVKYHGTVAQFTARWIDVVRRKGLVEGQYVRVWVKLVEQNLVFYVRVYGLENLDNAASNAVADDVAAAAGVNYQGEESKEE